MIEVRTSIIFFNPFIDRFKELSIANSFVHFWKYYFSLHGYLQFTSFLRGFDLIPSIGHPLPLFLSSRFWKTVVLAKQHIFRYL